MRQQGVFLPLDKLPCRSGQTGVFALAHLVHRLSQVTHDVKFVEQYRRLRHVPAGRIRKGLPHIHDDEANPPALLRPQPLVKLIQAGFRAVPTAKPDRSLPQQIADDNSIGLPLANGNLIDPDDFGRRSSGPAQLLAHVLLLQFLDGLPVQMQFLGDVLDRGRPTPPPHIESKSFGVKRIVGQPIQALPFHPLTHPTVNTPHIKLQVNTGVTTGQIPHSPDLLVIVTLRPATTVAALTFFRRRASLTTRALGSPKIPWTVEVGTKPSNRYASRSCRRRLKFSIHHLKQVLAPLEMTFSPVYQASNPLRGAIITHTKPRRPSNLLRGDLPTGASARFIGSYTQLEIPILISHIAFS